MKNNNIIIYHSYYYYFFYKKQKREKCMKVMNKDVQKGKWAHGGTVVVIGDEHLQREGGAVGRWRWGGETGLASFQSENLLLMYLFPPAVRRE